jgi:hypothetical protein
LVPGGEFARGLAAGRSAALELDRRLRGEERFLPFSGGPELDIVVWRVAAKSNQESSELAQRIFDDCAALNLHLALVQLPEVMFAPVSGTSQTAALPERLVNCLRSVLMKPEHAEWMDRIWERLTAATGHLVTGAHT